MTVDLNTVLKSKHQFNHGESSQIKASGVNLYVEPANESKA